METINRETILELIEQSPAIAVSLFMPRYSDAGSQARQDPIRLKNLLSQAEDELRALDMDLREAEALLQPLRDEVDAADFWKQGSAGLVAYLAHDFKRVYHVNQKLDEKVVVDTQFAVLPLVASMADGARYYILDLSENHNRLILVENGAATEIPVTAAPANLNESMRLEDREFQQQMHSANAAAVGAASFHGGGSWHDYEKEQFPLYCKQLNDAIVALLNEDRAPLLLVAEERVASFYKSENSYQHLVEQPVFGNHSDATPQALAAVAWPLVEPYVIQGAQDKLARMEAVKNTEKGVVDPVQVLDAAISGRIDTLFIDPQAELWGVLDLSTQKVTLHKQRSDKSNDLLEVAARETLRNAGLVLALDADKMPAETPLAALLRWPGGTATLRN